MQKTTAFVGTSIMWLDGAMDYLHSASTAATVEESNKLITKAQSLLSGLLRLADEASSELKLAESQASRSTRAIDV